MANSRIGNRYDKLVVIGEDGDNLELMCDCGKTVTRTVQFLVAPGYRTCGCNKGTPTKSLKLAIAEAAIRELKVGRGN